MKWIKASERLPDGHKKVYIRYQGDAFIGHKNYSEEDPKMVFQSITKTFFTNDCEWLDESPVEAAEGEEWGKLAGEFCDILFEANGTGAGSDVIIEHLKKHYHLLKKAPE